MARQSKYGEPLVKLQADIPRSLRDWLYGFSDEINEELRVRRLSRTDLIIALILLAQDHQEDFKKHIIRG